MKRGFHPLYDLLRADGSIVVNKNLARAIGLNEAVIYSELLSRYFYFMERDRIGPDGYFYNTIEDLERGTTLTRRQQDPAIRNLAKLGLIKVKLSGIPAKRHFLIVEDIDYLMQVLESGRIYPYKQTKQPDLPDVIRESCQVLADSFKQQGAVEDISPARVFEIIASGMAKR